jgi:hypothetical protein
MAPGPLHRAAALFCVIALLSVALFAQSPTGEIAGLVTDSSGAVVPNAEVTITSLNTGFVAHPRTSAAGAYYAAGLQPGIYAVAVAAPGFRRALADVRVEVGRQAQNDVRLEVGTGAEALTVTATGPQVNTATAALEGVVSGPTIRRRPLNGRQFLELAQLEPGVQVNDGGSVTGLKDGYAGVSVNGHSGLTTRVTVDGLDISDKLMGSITQNVSLDAVDEFQISRSNADTATGLNGAGAVNITGDPLPGANRGAYGRSAGCGAGALNRLIGAYNASAAGQPTPAGQALVNAGLFTVPQLVSLGAVAPAITPAPAGQVCLDWFTTTDIRLSRPIKIGGERVVLEPAWEWFNVLNAANYDLPSERLDGHLSGVVGSINGTTPANRPNRASLSRGSFSGGSPRSWQFVLRVSF